MRTTTTQLSWSGKEGRSGKPPTLWNSAFFSALEDGTSMSQLDLPQGVCLNARVGHPVKLRAYLGRRWKVGLVGTDRETTRSSFRVRIYDYNYREKLLLSKGHHLDVAKMNHSMPPVFSRRWAHFFIADEITIKTDDETQTWVVQVAKGNGRNYLKNGLSDVVLDMSLSKGDIATLTFNLSFVWHLECYDCGGLKKCPTVLLLVKFATDNGFTSGDILLFRLKSSSMPIIFVKSLAHLSGKRLLRRALHGGII
ncbi:hypothetical protein C2S51_029230 [Perilla frutescens var. frutescens]|nr:hypothetical protein C2S51_029230 [Perilla frutescens var. frutescens]